MKIDITAEWTLLKFLVRLIITGVAVYCGFTLLNKADTAMNICGVALIAFTVLWTIRYLIKIINKLNNQQNEN